MTQQTIVGVFDTIQHAEQAHDALRQAGFAESAIRVDAHQSAGTSERFVTRPADTGFMASVSEFFHDLFGGDDAGSYAEAVRRGGAVVSVTTDDAKIEAARAALAGAGAIDINRRVEAWRKEGYKGYEAGAKPYTAAEVASERERVIPVVQEELAVGKRAVDTGTVRVVSRVVERPVHEEVDLTSQRAVVDRRAVDRPASEADLAAMQRGAAVEVHETAEQAVVQKNARVVEEVVVGAEQTTERHEVTDTLRSNVVEVSKDAAPVDPARASKWRTHFDKHLTSQGRYEDFEPAYDYGYTFRRDPAYAQKDWAAVEPELQRQYATRYPQSSWDRARSAVRYGWEEGLV